MNIKTDSRKIKPGDTFIAIRGVDHDGHDYIELAIQNGAKKIICEEGEYAVATMHVADTRQYLEEYLYENVYPKIRDLKLIGVTGTNGKTTICYLVYQLLTKLGKKAAYIGTIGFYRDNEKTVLNNTTPDIDLLYEMLLECKERNIEYVVMETSSHALDKNRIYGLEFEAAAFTNLTQDHLDYHKTMENYALAKQKLFKRLRNQKIAIINIDDPYASYFILKENHNITISQTQGDILLSDMNFTHLGTDFKITYQGKTYATHMPMVGKYNIYNDVMALFLVQQLGNSLEEVLKWNETLSAPPGRMELIPYHNNSIFIDYAHTPDGVKSVLEGANEFKQGKIITIVGCGGDRDRMKRPLMGNFAVENSNYVIFTNDNPRGEDPKQIMDDILKGLKKSNYEVCFDRKEAIRKGIELLTEKDSLLILGKGHEDYQLIQGVKHHFSDKECVLDYID